MLAMMDVGETIVRMCKELLVTPDRFLTYLALRKTYRAFLSRQAKGEHEGAVGDDYRTGPISGTNGASDRLFT